MYPLVGVWHTVVQDFDTIEMSAKRMEEHLRTRLDCSSVRALSHSGGGGCISQGRAFEADGKRLFVKENTAAFVRKKALSEFTGLFTRSALCFQALTMFEGESASLTALGSTGCIRGHSRRIRVPPQALTFLDIFSFLSLPSNFMAYIIMLVDIFGKTKVHFVVH